MLLILYGATAEMWLKSREYIEKSGYRLIEKFNYAPDTPNLTTIYGQRKYVSESEFYENTDSLFRYEVGGIKIGFNQQQISDAVCDKADCLLTLSTDDVSFLAEIKRVYAEKVCLVYAYIDDVFLKKIIAGLKNITDEEADVRYKTGKAVKQCYLNNQGLFDHVVIYGGEESDFNYRALYKQYQSIIESLKSKSSVGNHYADIFISYSSKDKSIFETIKESLINKGITVFNPHEMLLPHNDFVSEISDAIQNAQIVIPLITENALGSQWVQREIDKAVECAENSGTLLFPVIEENIGLEQLEALSSRTALGLLSSIIIEGNEVNGAAEKLSEKVYKLLSAESELKSLSKQIDNYLYLRMYNPARSLQEEHLALCDEVYSLSNGSFISYEVCVMSRVKLISIMLDMKQYSEALEWSVETMNMLLEDNDDGLYDIVAEQFAMCCTLSDMTEDSVKELINDRLIIALRQFRQGAAIDDLVHRFLDNKKAVARDIQEEVSKVKSLESEENRIAQHGECAITLFEELLSAEKGNLSRNDLILGYERILNYCKHVGLKGEVADKCISRIAELSSLDCTYDGDGESNLVTALKIYLGQAAPQSGEYDVFISYKSEDTALAKKVYDYLTQSGKEVFFAKETLPQLGESEYEEMIFDAIDRSKHMVLIGSNPDYLKTSWVKDEWSTFNNEIREGRKNGNLILLLSDDIVLDKGRLPAQLRQREIVKMSKFRNRLLPYLR